MLRLKIVISKWLRGGRNGGLVGSLFAKLNERRNGRMCCLGFACRLAGVTKREMGNITRPSLLGPEPRKKVAAMFPWLFVDGADGTSSDAAQLMLVNDNILLTVQEKCAKIKAIFASHGCEVRFVR